MCMQVEAGVQGVSPGPSTEKYLTSKMKAVRLWGALSVAVLAVIAQYFDMYCLVKIGTSISSLSLLLVVGLITSCIRQVWYKPPTAVSSLHCSLPCDFAPTDRPQVGFEGCQEGCTAGLCAPCISSSR